MQSPTLLVLAAGLGSRYGGIKQMDPVGPGGEFILDYSVYDAWRAGFKSVVFIVREELVEPLKEHFGNGLEGKLEVAYVIQAKNDLPAPFACPETRVKPWGTGHAVWCARNVITGPFGMVNADDFYGKESFAEMAKLLASPEFNDTACGMVAFRLNNTLSENGSVSRGICSVDANGLLTGVVERTTIEAQPEGRARYQDENGAWQPLTGLEPASMNLWGFPQSAFAEIDAQLKDFLAANVNEPKKEFFIPSVVNTLVAKGWKAHVRNSPEKWFGMTYTEDRAIVRDQIAALTKNGVYPEKLWS